MGKREEKDETQLTSSVPLKMFSLEGNMYAFQLRITGLKLGRNFGDLMWAPSVTSWVCFGQELLFQKLLFPKSSCSETPHPFTLCLD